MQTAVRSARFPLARPEREEWVRRCARRLVELDPRRSIGALTLAEELWDDVWTFSPEIAAEMEHEAGWSDQ